MKRQFKQDCQQFHSCHRTVNIYVVIHFRGSMWSSGKKANLCRFLSFVYLCIAVGVPLIKRVWNSSHLHEILILMCQIFRS
jgi:hypothetical protein